MSHPTIKTRIDDSILFVSIDRPEKRNEHDSRHDRRRLGGGAQAPTIIPRCGRLWCMPRGPFFRPESICR